MRFNPRRPRGRRRRQSDLQCATIKFQSTPPARAATAAADARITLGAIQVSIHAARAGGDGSIASPRNRAACFNPRRPRGRRRILRRPDLHVSVSIHAARAGGDVNCRPTCAVSMFQSTPPARAATTCNPLRNRSSQFQSTPPARAATTARRVLRLRRVSIHAARAGGDSGITARRRGQRMFQSTPPARAATDARRAAR